MDPAVTTLIAHALSTAQTVFGTVAATYTRGEDSATVDVTLTQAASWLTSPEEGISTRMRQTQFIVPSEAIDFGDGPTEPRSGDRLAFPLRGYDLVFEARPPQNNEPCFAAVDPLEVAWRIWAKRISRTPA